MADDDELEPAAAVPEPDTTDGTNVPQEDLAAAAPGSDDQEPGVPSSPRPAAAESAETASVPTMTDEVLPVGPSRPEATPATSLIDDGTLPLSLSLDGCSVSPANAVARWSPTAPIFVSSPAGSS